MGDYSWLLNLIVLFLLFSAFYLPYKDVKDYLGVDNEIATIIRCQKSIEYLQEIRTEGYIAYDTELDKKFKNLEIDLRPKLKAEREKRNKCSWGASYPFLDTPVSNDFDPSDSPSQYKSVSNTASIDLSSESSAESEEFGFLEAITAIVQVILELIQQFGN